MLLLLSFLLFRFLQAAWCTTKSDPPIQAAGNQKKGQKYMRLSVRPFLCPFTHTHWIGRGRKISLWIAKCDNRIRKPRKTGLRGKNAPARSGTKCIVMWQKITQLRKEPDRKHCCDSLKVDKWGCNNNRKIIFLSLLGTGVSSRIERQINRRKWFPQD